MSQDDPALGDMLPSLVRQHLETNRLLSFRDGIIVRLMLETKPA